MKKKVFLNSIAALCLIAFSLISCENKTTNTVDSSESVKNVADTSAIQVVDSAADSTAQTGDSAEMQEADSSSEK